MGNGEDLETPGNGADDAEDTAVTDMDVNILGLGKELDHIKGELKEVREVQDEQVEEIGAVKERVNAMSTTLDVVFQTQGAHGKELGAIGQQCHKRFETCSQAMKKLRDHQAGNEKDTGSWPAEAK